MSLRVALGVFHGGAAALMCWGFQQLHTLAIDEWLSRQKGGHFQYLTNQGLVLAALTMAISLLADLVQARSLRRAKRALLLIALPLAVVISSIYWTLLTVAPFLILPPQTETTSGEPSSAIDLDSAIDPLLFRIPLSLDLTLHASPVIALLIDFFLLEEKYPPRAVRRTAPILAVLYGVGYGCFVEYCASFNGRFPYPFLNVPIIGRLAIYAAAVVVAFSSMRTLNFLHN